MSNMSYCRFQNTERDVFDCQYALEDLFNNKSTLSADELEAAKKLVGRCADLLQVIVDMADIDDDANLLEEIVDRARGELDRANAVWENEYARLIGEYQAWMREQGLNLGSADEHLTDESLTDDQRTWLKGFVEDWEEITLQEHDAQRREK